MKFSFHHKLVLTFLLALVGMSSVCAESSEGWWQKTKNTASSWRESLRWKNMRRNLLLRNVGFSASVLMLGLSEDKRDAAIEALVVDSLNRAHFHGEDKEQMLEDISKEIKKLYKYHKYRYKLGACDWLALVVGILAGIESIVLAWGGQHLSRELYAQWPDAKDKKLQVGFIALMAGTTGVLALVACTVIKIGLWPRDRELSEELAKVSNKIDQLKESRAYQPMYDAMK